MSRSGQKTLYDRIRLILESARSGVARSVNSTQVVANWLIGREIVEEEQRDKARAGYGTSLLKDLATRLKSDSMVGYSVQNLQYMRQFYITYPNLVPLGPIRHALRGKLSKENSDAISHILRDVIPNALTKRSGIENHHAVRGESWDPGRLHPNLSWTHYRTLLRVSRGDARAFYEIEAVKNNWAARELERQINSLLFERLAKSRDKAGLVRLARKGQEIQKPEDVFKDPLVMEFLGLPENHRLVESKLESALINNLQDFLLELGKGFAFVARQLRLTLDGDHFYVDLVFYHTILKCHVLIDLKVGKLTHQDLGQLHPVRYSMEDTRCITTSIPCAA